MKTDLLVFEIGSTTTKATAVDDLAGRPRRLGQGMAPTTVREGDVTIGLQNALTDLRRILGIDDLEGRETFACASAAGGLRMSVHGLVYEMTARAGREAALGAGANLEMVTAGLLTPADCEALVALAPNIVLLAGGVDHGDRKVAIANAEAVAALRLDVPVVFAGNVDARAEVLRVFRERGREAFLTITDNVYPAIDRLAVEGARGVIQDVFERHITKAPGMERIRSLVGGSILPTPGAVMKAATLLADRLGDLLVLDVGGATTDVHSVTSGSDAVRMRAIAPEPYAKRTVEGDLGVFVNRRNLIAACGGPERLAALLGRDRRTVDGWLESFTAIPEPDRYPLVGRLAARAVAIALDRHAGRLVDAYGSAGTLVVAEGRDLTAVRTVIGTGGPLVKLPDGEAMIGEALAHTDRKRLYPAPGASVRIDRDYVFAVAGAIAGKHPEAALRLMLDSLGEEE